MKKKLIIISIVLFIGLAATIASTMFRHSINLFSLSASHTSEPTATQYVTPTLHVTAEPTPEPTPAPTPIPDTNIVVGFAGDIMAHQKLYESVMRWEDGRKIYDFNPMFKYIAPALEYPDLMIANLESPIAGRKAGYSIYPSLTLNFPDGIEEAIKNSGIDLVLNGNNHAYDKSEEGLYRTLDMLDSVELMHTGTWRNAEERAVPTVVDLQGIKVGIVSATFSLNGRERYINDDILDYLVCFTDVDQVAKEIDLCREYGAEIVIVSPHMGSEYKQYTSDAIREYAKAYIAAGADLVVAHHPHVLQASELVQAETEDGKIKEGVVFWSIGNFLHNQTSLGKDFAKEVRETGIIVYVNIKKNNNTNEVTITSLEYLPTWVLRRADLYPRIYAIIPAGNEIDFNAPPYDEETFIDLSFAGLERAWNIAISQVGTDCATPLSTVPVRETQDTP